MAEEISEISVGQFDTVSQLIASSVSLQLAVIGLIIGKHIQLHYQIHELTSVGNRLYGVLKIDINHFVIVFLILPRSLSSY